MKAMLVIDVPDDIFIDDCRIEFRVIENVMEMCVEDGVKRLKPMPQKKELEESGNSLIDDCKEYYSEGWNDCIDELLGERE